VQHGRAVVEPASVGQRHSHSQDTAQRLGFLGQYLQRMDRLGKKRAVMEQVGAGVAGDAKFGEHGEFHSAPVTFAGHAEDCGAIVGDGGGTHPRHTRRDTEHTEAAVGDALGTRCKYFVVCCFHRFVVSMANLRKTFCIMLTLEVKTD